MQDYDAIILGAGGAGLMAAATAGQAGARVLVIDHAEAAGKKILISGGGRCNFTNTGTVPERFLSENPHFAKSALSRYTQWDFVALVDRHGIAWHEKTLGQLFCDGSARRSWRCCWKNAARAAWRSGSRRPSERSAMPTAASRRRRTRAEARHRDRRAVDSEDGRDRHCLRHRPPLRAEGRASAPRAGPADARSRTR
jgi:hypothetical protein